MFLLDVFPIIKGTWTKSLQYWSSEYIQPGSIIKASLRGKQIHVFISQCIPLKEAKHLIKEAEFKTRKIDNSTPLTAVSPGMIKAILVSAGYFLQPISPMLKTCIPTSAFTSLDSAQKSSGSKISAATIKKSDIVALSTPTDDRIGFYKSIIREEIAKNKSVLLIAPTIRTAEILFESIKKGIEHISHIIHSKQSKKQIDENWSIISNSDRGSVIVTTPQYMSVPRADIETIILENESSRAYKTFHPPYFDWRFLIEQYAKEIHARLILGDQLLRLETIKRVQDHDIHELFPLSYRLPKETEIIVVDMLADKQKSGSYRMLSEELQSMIEYAQKKKQQILLFTARRGLAPQTVCSDCQETVVCQHCQAPVVLHTSKKQGRYFLCHHCGRERNALEACQKCQSWNLTTLGIGSDTVEQEIKDLYSDIPVFRIDRDSAKTDAQAKKIMREFKKEPNGILIGTEMALSYLDHVPYIGVVSMESLFSIPDFRIHERISHIYIRLLEIAQSHLLIQSRNHKNILTTCLEQYTFSEYIKEELQMRKILSYPPYATMFKISLKGKEALITKQAEWVQDLLKEYQPQIFPAMIPGSDGPSINIICTVPNEKWDTSNYLHSDLYRVLETIAQVAPVQVQPESFI